MTSFWKPTRKPWMTSNDDRRLIRRKGTYSQMGFQPDTGARVRGVSAGRNSASRKAYLEEYNRRPEVIERRRLQQRERRLRPDVQEKEKAYSHMYERTKRFRSPERLEEMRKYHRDPERKKQIRERYKTDEKFHQTKLERAKRFYHEHPEIKESRKVQRMITAKRIHKLKPGEPTAQELVEELE